MKNVDGYNEFFNKMKNVDGYNEFFNKMKNVDGYREGIFILSKNYYPTYPQLFGSVLK